MKGKVLFAIVCFVLVSAFAFAQSNTQGQSQGQAQSQGKEFGRGGYVGNVLKPITINELANEAPNAFVIVSGYLIQQRVPGTYVLADKAKDHTISVVVYFNEYDWVNLSIDAATPVLIYGIVSKSDLRTQIIAERVETGN